MNKFKYANRIIWQIIGILFFLFSIFTLYIGKGSSESDHLVLLVLVTVGYYLCIQTWVQHTNRLLSLYVVFVIYTYFSNVGQSIAFIFNLNSYLKSVYILFDLPSICKMLRFQFACVCSLNLGTSLYFNNCNNIVQRIDLYRWNDKVIQQKKRDSSKEIIYIVYCITTVWVLGYCIWQIMQRQIMSYNELYASRDTLSSGAQFLFVLLGYALVLKNSHRKLVYLCWIAATVLLFIAGTRSMAIVYIGSLISTVPITNKELFSKKLIPLWSIAIVFAFALISFTSAVRTSAIGSGTFQFNLVQNLYDSLSEFGASARPVLYTMRYIDGGGEHYQTLLYTLLHGIIPTGMMEALGLTRWNIHLATWVTNYSQITYTGLGYSCIAEAYMNFGMFGWMFWIIYGLLISFAENSAYRRAINGSILYPSAFFLLLSKQLFFARANFELVDTFYRYSIYAFLVWVLYTAGRNGGKVPIHNTNQRREEL